MRISAVALALLAPLAACNDAPRTEASSLDLTITVRLQNAKLDFVRTFVQRGDDRHRCLMPGRIRLPTTEKPNPSPRDPPNFAAGYTVLFGPDRSTWEDGGSTVPMGSGPGGPPAVNPIVNYFSLRIDPMPGQTSTSGPVKLSRSFEIGFTAKGAWKGRFAEDNPKTSGSVTLDRDGLGGRFRLANVEPHLAHNRMAESEWVTVTGSWRCPAN
jgi:hypothetical protein